MIDKEAVMISQVISGYSRKRLYKIFRETADSGDFKRIREENIAGSDYNLLLNEKGVSFRPVKSKHSIPLSFSIEDLETGRKDDAEVKEIFRDSRNGLFLLDSEWNRDLKLDVILEPLDGHLMISGRIKSNSERIIRAGVELEVDAVGWNWYEGLRDLKKIENGSQYYLHSRDYTLGKRGKLPFYSFGNISNAEFGLTAGVNPQEPRLFEIVYDAAVKRYQLFFDMAMSPKTKNFPNEAAFSVFLTVISGEDTGFRGSVKKYYQLFPKAAEKRVKKEGIWMPFADIAPISNAEDFHFAYHELNVHYEGGLRSKADIAYNVSRGIYNFAYTEPWLCWLHMPKDMERTYDNALRLMEKNLESEDEKTRDFASACFLCGIKNNDGKYFVRFADTPWCCGGVYNTNTEPSIKAEGKASINRAAAELKQIIRSISDLRFHGAYLDSMQATEVGDDYDERHFEVTEFPLAFDKKTRKPAISQFITAYSFTELLADYLRDKNKLLMGNFPAAFSFFMQHIDVPGEETGWMENDNYKPMEDKELSMRRALCFKKPYLFLQAVDFDKFSKDMVEKYMKRCLFYGMFPSMFSFNAQDAPYWENSAWYNRDRDLFKRYLPHIESLSKAGWEPVNGVRVDNDRIFIEQFGKQEDENIYITCCNQTDSVQEGGVNLVKYIRQGKKIKADDVLNNKSYSLDSNNSCINLRLEKDEVILLKLIME